MSVGSVSASNGSFYITDANGGTQQCDLGTLMMMLNLNRTENLDAQLADQLAEIQDRNTLISNLTKLMSEARRRKESGIDDDSSSAGNANIPLGGESKKLRDWLADFGMTSTWTDITGDAGSDSFKQKWDANINAIKAKIDTLNNDSQMANIKLQNLLEKRNNAFEMATKVMDTNNQTVQSTLRNL